MPPTPELDPTADALADPRSALLSRGLQALGLPATDQQRRQLLAYLDLLAAWNRSINLTAVRDPQQMVVHHLLDSLAALAAVDRQLAMRRPRVLDVGSGAGLPGAVWAVLRQDWPIACVDAVAKKAGFVRQAATELGLRHVQALHGRVESMPAVPSDLVVSRAFASLLDFVALTARHLAPGGCWLALKGQLPQDELRALPPTVDVFHVEQIQVPGLNAQRCLIWMRMRA
jgi:16S rRNA (guanine527-N7)-methyltransferase